MNKHDEVEQDLEIIEQELVFASNMVYETCTSNDIDVLGENFKRLQKYITDMEAVEKEFDDCKKYASEVSNTLSLINQNYLKTKQMYEELKRDFIAYHNDFLPVEELKKIEKRLFKIMEEE
jgi:archaellum component FlaC